jgi:DNA-binding response OmpR family regulator
MKVLIAEDDELIRKGLVDLLQSEGYQTVSAPDGGRTLETFRKEAPDIVCLDIMMPEISGYDVCREIRRQNPTVPILFISAKSEEFDKVLGLELGADDFITKPFGVREVLARIRAITRRCRAAGDANAFGPPYRMGDLDVFPAELRATRGSASLEISLRDVKILDLLYRNTGKVVTRDQLYEICWGAGHLPNSRTVDQHISQLRKRIETDPANPAIIRTVHGAGYRYEGSPG